jgi:hypothetical protein
VSTPLQVKTPVVKPVGVLIKEAQKTVDGIVKLVTEVNGKGTK